MQEVLPFPERLVATDFAASVGFLENIQRRFRFRTSLGFALPGGFAEQILQQGDYHQEGNEPDQGLSQPTEQHAAHFVEHPTVTSWSVHVVLDRGLQEKPDPASPCQISLISYLLTQL
jgi:hypothetical protein